MHTSSFQQALRIREQQLEPEHLETADLLHDFADFQQARDSSSEAAFLYQRVLMIREHVLGPNHPLTVETSECLHKMLVTPDRTEVEQSAPKEEE